MSDIVRDIMTLRNPEGPEAAEIERLRAERGEARAYLSLLLQIKHPTVEPLLDLLGVCTQIDNALAGLLAERDRMEDELRDIMDRFDLQDCELTQDARTARDIARAALKETGHE
jgi:hypothetical protein